eukprot:4231265-Pyramimonas_sp.AAC.1
MTVAAMTVAAQQDREVRPSTTVLPFPGPTCQGVLKECTAEVVDYCGWVATLMMTCSLASGHYSVRFSSCSS